MVAAKGHDDPAFPHDHRHQRAGPHLQILQLHANIGIIAPGDKFQRLGLTVHQPVQPFDPGAGHIDASAHIAQHLGAGNILGADDGIQPHRADDVRIGHPVVFHNHLGHALAHREQAGHQVFLIPVAQGDKGVHLVQPFLLQQLLIGAVAVNHIDLRQAFAKHFRLFAVDFNHGNPRAGGHDHFGQVVADAPSAQHHHVFHPHVVFAKKAEIVGDGYHVGGHMHPVAGLNDKIAVGNDHLARPLHGGVQHLGNAAQLMAQLPQGMTDNRVLFLSAEFHHFHPAPGEGLDIGREGEAQQAADFQRGSPLRVHRQVDAHFLLQNGQAVVIFRVAYAGNGKLGAQPLGDQAAQHIGFIAGGGGDDDVRLFRARVHQGGGVGPVAPYAHYVQRVLAAAQHFLAAVHNHHGVFFPRQMLGNHMPDLTVAHNQNSHSFPPFDRIPFAGPVVL